LTKLLFDDMLLKKYFLIAKKEVKKMKKTTSISLVVVLCLVLTSCSAFGGRNKIREQAETAPKLSLENYYDTLELNEAKAKAEYDGKVFRYTAKVTSIKDNYCYVGKSLDFLGEIDADAMLIYLDEEDLIKLNVGETHTFVGVFSCKMPRIPCLKDAILLYD